MSDCFIEGISDGGKSAVVGEVDPATVVAVEIATKITFNGITSAMFYELYDLSKVDLKAAIDITLKGDNSSGIVLTVYATAAFNIINVYGTIIKEGNNCTDIAPAGVKVHIT